MFTQRFFPGLFNRSIEIESIKYGNEEEYYLNKHNVNSTIKISLSKMYLTLKIRQFKNRTKTLTLNNEDYEKVKVYREPDYQIDQGV